MESGQWIMTWKEIIRHCQLSTVNYQFKKKAMKKNISLFITLFLFAGIQHIYAQAATLQKTYRVAIFAPLYLDSAFTGYKLRSEKTLPNFSMGGVDFVQGAEIAFDTLSVSNHRVEAYIYDSKSFTKPVRWLIQNKKLDNIDLIIGSAKDAEYYLLAQFAAQRKIPFVSATYPNDGRIRQNPFLMIVNSTLKTHCEGIFNYILQKHGTDNIYLVKQKNDNRIDNYFKEINLVDGKPLLKIRTIMLDSSISSTGLRYLVDTTKTMVIIGASLDETFAAKLADACYPIQKTNSLIYIGMPNWDGFRSWYKKDTYTGFPIHYTTPYYDEKANAFSAYLDNKYFELYRTKPSDMATKGFEAAYYFTSILINHFDNFIDHINDSIYAPFHNFNFRPVYYNARLTNPDYYENKHLFIMQILNGEIVREW